MYNSPPGRPRLRGHILKSLASKVKSLASSIPVLGLERVCLRKGCPWPRIFFVSLASSLVSSTPPLMFWLLTFKSLILINALLASEAAFWMHYTIALIIVCSATNIAFAFSKWIRDQVVELFQDCASVVRVTI